jgi:hypothetical protein
MYRMLLYPLREATIGGLVEKSIAEEFDVEAHRGLKIT